MKTKKLLTLAIIAALPFGVMAENISGDMYTAPLRADTDHPAPTTNVDRATGPYGRVNIDTADQEHIATTAYVKGAYNSAIAAVNKSYDDLNEAVGGEFGMINEQMGNISEYIQQVDSKVIDIYTVWDSDSTTPVGLRIP